MFNLVFSFLDLSSNWTRVLGVISQDGHSDDVSRDATSSADISLLADINVGHILVLAKEGQVQYDLKWLGVSGEHDKVSNTSVQSFGGLIGSLFEQLEILGLVQQIQNALVHGVVGLGPGA